MRTRTASNGNGHKDIVPTGNPSSGLVPFKQGDTLPDAMRASENEVFGSAHSAKHRIVPMLRLMQGLSPQVVAGDAKAGTFVHNLSKKVLGGIDWPRKDVNTPIKVILLTCHTEAILYGPRDKSGQREVLARSSDGKEWDSGYANKEISVTLPGGRDVVYQTGPNPESSGLFKWGSQNPFDKNNRAPAMGITYRMFFQLPELEQFPLLMILEKTATQSAKELLTAIDYRTDGGDGPAQQAQVWDMLPALRQGNGTSWYVPAFTSVDLTPDPALFQKLLKRARTIDTLRWEIQGHNEKEEMTGGSAGGTSY